MVGDLQCKIIHYKGLKEKEQNLPSIVNFIEKIKKEVVALKSFVLKNRETEVQQEKNAPIWKVWRERL